MNEPRQRPLALLALGVASLLISGCARPGARATGAAEERPNVVVILADDLGWGDLSVYGSPENQTPNLDRLAREGVKFTDFYAAAPVCSPSRASLLTGRFPLRVGVYSWVHPSHRMHLREEEVTIAEMLRQAGYDTGHMGKWHLGYDLVDGSGPAPDPGDHGFDHWLATGNNAEPSHRNPVNFVRNGEALGEVAGYSSHIVVDEAIDWLEERKDSGKPFFLNVWFHEPHQRVAAPAELEARHSNTRLPAYYGSVENMDRAVGRLIERLEQMGVWENTLLVFTSDNGSYLEGSNGELRGRKTGLWEGGIRVPGIVRWPGRAAPGGVSDTPAGIVDLLPTIADAVGVETPQRVTLDGVSLVPLLTGGRIERNKPLYWFYSPSRPVAAIREGEWSLVANPEPDLPRDNLFLEEWIGRLKEARLVNFRLYNLQDDPQQRVDLSAAEPARLEAMRRQLTRLHREVMNEAYDWRGQVRPSGTSGQAGAP